MMDHDLKYAVIVLAAFSVMVVALAVVGFFAIVPLQAGVYRLTDRIDAVEKQSSDERARIKTELNARLDAFRQNMDARLADIRHYRK